MVNRVRLLIVALVAVPLLLVAADIIVGDSTPIASSPNAHFTSFSVGGKTYAFTGLATNQSSLAKGLMGAKITSATKMLFVFPSAGYYSFWMDGVNASLDMIWIDTPAGSDTGSVVYMQQDAPPCSVALVCTTYNPTAKANYVIEAQGGFASADGIQLGTQVTLR